MTGILDWALGIWSRGLELVETILTLSPQEFASGGGWNVVTAVFGAMQAVAYPLLIICFYFGLVRSSFTMMELRRPAVAVTLLLRFLIVKALIDSGIGLLQMLMQIGQGIIRIVFTAGIDLGRGTALPDEIRAALEGFSFWGDPGGWLMLFLVSVIAAIVLIVMTFMVVLTVYGRFFKIYVYAALAPIPLAFFGGEPTQSTGISFLKAFGGVCAEGAVIAVACVIYSAVVSAVPTLSFAGSGVVSELLNYIVGVILQSLLLMLTIKGADYVAQKLTGL